jgi:steroid delta-isomerase-like uncharacterized protein
MFVVMGSHLSRACRIVLVVAALTAAGCSTAPATASTTMSTTAPDENKRRVRALFEDCFTGGKLELLDELIAPTYSGPQGEKGADGFKRIVVGLRTAFPDIRYAIEDITAEGDRVALRWRWTGTHRGPFRTFAATMKPFENTGMATFQLRDGKIVAGTIETDRLGFLQQLGVVPADAGAPPGPKQ